MSCYQCKHVSSLKRVAKICNINSTFPFALKIIQYDGTCIKQKSCVMSGQHHLCSLSMKLCRFLTYSTFEVIQCCDKSKWCYILRGLTVYMNVTTETLYKTWRVLFQCSGSFTFTYCVLTVTTDIGLAAHRLCHVVQPAADLSGSVQLPHQLPAAQVLEGVCSGGGRAYWIIQRETRQRTCPEEPSEFLQPETSWTHHHSFQQRLGEDLCPLQI